MQYWLADFILALIPNDGRSICSSVQVTMERFFGPHTQGWGWDNERVWEMGLSLCWDKDALRKCDLMSTDEERCMCVRANSYVVWAIFPSLLLDLLLDMKLPFSGPFPNNLLSLFPSQFLCSICSSQTLKVCPLLHSQFTNSLKG